LIRYGFDDVGLDRIIAQTMAANTGSRAVVERVGLTYVRTFPTSTSAPVEGVEEGEVEYELTRKQWERRHDEYDSGSLYSGSTSR
jgi:RimJ/RimL family protein N-acetyltransferase